jgi:hypothetical protein
MRATVILNLPIPSSCRAMSFEDVVFPVSPGTRCGQTSRRTDGVGRAGLAPNVGALREPRKNPSISAAARYRATDGPISLDT